MSFLWTASFVSRGISVNIATQLRARRPEFNSRRKLGFFPLPPSPNRLWNPPSLLSNGYRELYSRKCRGRGAKLTTHFHLAARLRTGAAITPLPHTSSTAWCLMKQRIRLHGLLRLRCALNTHTFQRLVCLQVKGQGT